MKLWEEKANMPSFLNQHLKQWLLVCKVGLQAQDFLRTADRIIGLVNVEVIWVFTIFDVLFYFFLPL